MKSKFLITIIFIQLLQSASVAGVTNALDLTLAAQIALESGADASAPMLVADNHLFIAQGDSGLSMLDISDPIHPAIVGRYQGSAPISAIAVSGQFAYLAESFSGFEVIDLATAPDIQRVGAITNLCAAGIDSDGPNLVVSDPCAGKLIVFDAHQPSSPTVLGSLQLGQDVTAVMVDKHYAFVVSPFSWLSIVDINTSIAPTLVTNIPGYFFDPISIDGNTLYAWSRGPQAIDISNPQKPTQLPHAFPSFTTNDFPVISLDFGHGLLAAVTPGPIELFSEADAGHYILVGRYSRSTTLGGREQPDSAVIVGHYAYVHSRDGVVQIVDVGTYSNISVVNQFAAPAPAAFKSGYLYFAGNDSLIALNISNPLASITFPPNLPHHDGPTPAEMVSSGVIAIPTEFNFDTFDLSDPANPLRLGQASSSDFLAMDYHAMDSSRAFCSRANELNRVDISNPSEPRLVAQDSDAVAFGGLALVGDYLYAAGTMGTDGSPALVVYDVSGPTNLHAVARIAVAAGIQKFLVGNSNLLAIQAGRIVIYSLDDPSSPSVAGSLTSLGAFGDAIIQGNDLYTTGGSGLEVFDISTPSSIRRIAGNSTLFFRALLTDDRALCGISYGNPESATLAFLPLFDQLPAFTPISPSLDSSGFHFTVHGIPGSTVRVQRSSTLGAWQDWQTVSFATNSVAVTDPSAQSASYYRIVAP